jgi:hypothetical protein
MRKKQPTVFVIFTCRGEVFVVHDALDGAFAGNSPDSPGFACTETLDLATETIGFG